MDPPGIQHLRRGTWCPSGWSPTCR
jgi:hypothetical protein